MSDGLPLIVTWGERAVYHAVAPDTPAGELPGLLALYLGDADGAARVPVRIVPEGELPLDPDLPIGGQVDPETEIGLRPAP